MNKESLKSKFKNGMIPDESDFSELIDFAEDTTIFKPKNFCEIPESRDIRFYMGIGGGENNTEELFASFGYSGLYTSDYFLKGRKNEIFKAEEISVTEHSYKDLATITKGQMWEPSFAYANQYTLEVGTTLEIKAKMEALYGNFYMNGQGGLWEVYVDGELHKSISTFGNIGNKEEEIASGLNPMVETKIELVFVGEDPDNPISNPRGWIKDKLIDSDLSSFIMVSAGDSTTKMLTPLFPLTNDFSNKEFALSVSDGAGGKAEWFPEHNNIQTTFQGNIGMRTLTLDGVEYDVERPLSRTYFNEAKLVQKVEAQLPTDNSVRAIITFTATLKDGENHNTVRVDWKQDSRVHSGYIFMTPMDTPQFVDNLLTEEFEFVSSKPDSSETSHSTEMTNINALKYHFTSNREGKENILLTTTIHKQSEDIKRLFFQHRLGEIEKLYPMQYNQTDKKAGEIDYFKGTYKIEYVPNANEIYKLN